MRPSNARRKSPFQHAHETGEHDQIHFRRLQRADKCALGVLVQFGAEFSRRNELRRKVSFARVRQNSRVLDIAQNDARPAPEFSLARMASAMATKLEPLPEPRTPKRNLCSLATGFSYKRNVSTARLFSTPPCRISHHTHEQNGLGLVVLNYKKERPVHNHFKRRLRP